MRRYPTTWPVRCFTSLRCRHDAGGTRLGHLTMLWSRPKAFACPFTWRWLTPALVRRRKPSRRRTAPSARRAVFRIPLRPADRLLVHYFDLLVDYLAGKAIDRDMHPITLLAFHNKLS